jgi:hypothetical protein
MLPAPDEEAIGCIRIYRQATTMIGTRSEVLGIVTAAFSAGDRRHSKGLFDISFSSDQRKSAAQHRKPQPRLCRVVESHDRNRPNRGSTTIR